MWYNAFIHHCSLFLILVHLKILLLCHVPFTHVSTDQTKYFQPLSDVDHHEDDEDEHDVQHDHESFLGKEESKKFDQLTPEESKERLG